MFFIKLLSLCIVYFFLTGLFKKVNFGEERNKIQIENKEKHSKLIYIVLDALRFDYTVEIKNSPGKHIHNKMPFYASLSKFHALSVCGIPTSTTCRITGLLTGAPSNFLEGAKTFMSSRILIDNLVEQAHRKMSTAFYGDKTWVYLFPYLENVPHSTVDPYTKHDLLGEEKRVMRDMIDGLGVCDATFCHLITLDSFGHAFGTNHKIIEETLVRFDNFIKAVYEKMDDTTLLLITSDHGVTDGGAHGGVTKEEMSSVVSFISKKGLKTSDPSKLALQLRNEAIGQFYDLNTPLVQTSQKYPTVHQDDILPTICYLLNLPIPSNSYGNFIHELVEDQMAYLSFCELKKQNLKNFNQQAAALDAKEPFLNSHYKLTKEIYESVSGKESNSLIFCLILSIFVLIKYTRVQIGYRTVLLLVLSLHVSISVISVINEDLFWLCCFLIFNFSPINVLSSLLYLGIDTKFGIYTEWLAQFKQSLFLDSYYNGSFMLIYLLFVFSIGKKVIAKSFSHPLELPTALICDLLENPTLFIPLYKYFYRSHFTPEFNLDLVSTFPSLNVLCSIVFRPLECIFLLFIVKHLEYIPDTTSLFTLLNLSIGYTGMIKQIQSLDYDIAYVFSSNPNVMDALIPSLIYFIYPRFNLFKMYLEKRRLKAEDKKKSLDDYFCFNFLSLFTVFVTSFYFFDSMVFHVHFASRCFFVSFYFVVDLILSLML